MTQSVPLLFIGLFMIGCGAADSPPAASGASAGKSPEILVASTHSSAQPDTVVISGPPSCSECVIERYHVATVHDTSYGPGALSDYSLPHPTADGRFFVINGDHLYRTDIGGAVIRQVGRAGEGPGEYLFPMYVWDTPAHYAVLDIRLRRLTRLRKSDLAVLGTSVVPIRAGGTKPVIFSDGSMIVSSRLRTREGIGLRFHRVSDGGLVGSFGEGEEFPRELAASGDTAFWAAYLHDYRVELWSRSGQLLKVLKRKAGWFRPPDESTEAGDQYSSLQGLHEDPEGLLWIYVATLTRSTFGGNEITPEANGSVVEVIDPDRGTVLASRQMKGEFRTPLMEGFYYMVRNYTSAGHILLPVWGYRLQRGNSDSTGILEE